MNCPYCGHDRSRVVDSRDVDDGIRRRRKCEGCNSRFTTYERYQRRNLFVIKKDLRREEFDRDKLATGIRKACEKRPLPTGTIDKLVENLEADLYRQGKVEIPSTLIGDMVIERLRELDHIAYIRFASVYREFGDLTTLKQAVDNLVSDQSRPPRIPANQLPLLPDGDSPSISRRRSRNVKKNIPVAARR